MASLYSNIKTIGLKRLTALLPAVYRHGFTLPALLKSAFTSTSSAYLEDDTKQISYTQLYAISISTARFINNTFNITPKSKVLLISHNSIEFVTMLFGASGTGANVFLLNPNQTPQFYQDFISSTKPHLIICEPELKMHFITCNIPVLCTTCDIPESKELKTTWRKKSNITILSSGSTGIPSQEKRKTTVLPFLSPLAEIIRTLKLEENTAVLVSTPLFHGYGLAAFLLSVFLGKNIRLTRKFDADKTVKLLENGIDCWVAVPLMLQKLHNVDKLNVKIITGGDVLPRHVVNQINTIPTIQLYNMYGTSKTGVCTIATPDDLKKHPGTIGRMMHGIEAKISDSGELLVKCPWAADDNKEGYNATGDIVTKNSESFYFYKSRKDDMMVIGGENIYPLELENIFYTHPNVIWVKAGSTMGNDAVPAIFVEVVLRDTSELAKKDFNNWARQHLPRYMMPKSVVFLEEIKATKLLVN